MKFVLLIGTFVALVGCGVSSPANPDSGLASTELRRRQDVVLGSELSSQYSGVQKMGGYLTYQGPAQAGCFSFGPYASQEGQNIKLEGSIELEAKFTPAVFETCNKRDWKEKCVGWDTHLHNHGLTIDLIGYANGEPFRKALEIKNPDHASVETQTFSLGTLNFNGATTVEKVELRVCDIDTYEIAIAVRQVQFDWVWEEACDDPYTCTTPDDIARFLSETKASIEPATRAAIVAHSQYLRLKASENDFACLIQSVEQSQLYPEVTAQLKQNFQQQFSRAFVSGQAVCDGSQSASHIMNEPCYPGMSSPACDLYSVFMSNRELLWDKMRLIPRYRESRSLNNELTNQLNALHGDLMASWKVL